MASLTRWTWVWVKSGSWWWTGRPGMLWFVGLRRVGHDWATELNWYRMNIINDCKEIHEFECTYKHIKACCFSVLSNSLWPHESQYARPPCPSPTPGVHADSCPSSQWCHPAILSSVDPFSSCPSPSQHQSLFQWVNSLHEVAKVLEFQHYHHSLQRTPRADLL